tara:strand:+ start:7599 stop:8990 length:1392 start_codon:yes stop_codon:yes gene_type:complete
MSISSFLQKKFLESLFFPAHNRGEALPKEFINLLNSSAGGWDLPELPELGSPLSCSGLIPNAQNYFSKKFHTNNCWFGVNGASGLIQSAMIAMANPGDYLLMPRNIHNCVLKTCTLLNIIPIFFDLPYSEDIGQFLPITSEWLSKVINDESLKEINIAGIILVNPYYQGYSADIGSLIEICHEKKLPVLVDEAHGSYFLFCEEFGLPKSAVRAKADLVVHSLHKSLNSLTQTAVLWHCGENIDKNKITDSLNLLQTTSPSALLLSSCEESILDWMNTKSLENYKNRISEARNIFQQLTFRGVPLVKTDDPLKIVLNTGCYGIDGFTADKFFYKNGIIAELPEMMTLTFCLGFSKHNNFINSFEKLWKDLIFNTKKKNKLKNSKPPFSFINIPDIQPAVAWREQSNIIAIKDSVGKISAEMVCPYPPGIPLLVPGERIDQERVDWLLEQGLYCEDLADLKVRVL